MAEDVKKSDKDQTRYFETKYGHNVIPDKFWERPLFAVEWGDHIENGITLYGCWTDTSKTPEEAMDKETDISVVIAWQPIPILEKPDVKTFCR